MDPAYGDVGQLVSAAVVVWTGWGRTTWPARDERLMVEEFGHEQALDLLPLIQRLEDDFSSSDARFTEATNREMAEVAAARFRARHPGLSEAAIHALAWCCAWDYR